MTIHVTPRVALGIVFVAGLLVGTVVGGPRSAEATAGSVPTGGIILWPAASSCPSGWATYTSLNGRFPRGATSSGSGGVATHTHAIPSHNHGFYVPSHSHYLDFDSQGAARTVWMGSYEFAAYDTDNREEPHTHRVTGYTGSGGGTTSSTSSETLTAASATSLPPFLNVRYCRKR